MRKLSGKIQNIVIDGPLGVGKTSIANNLLRTLVGVRKNEFLLDSEECIADGLEGKSGVIVDGGPLSRIVFRKRQGEDFKEERGLEESTLLVLLYADPVEINDRTRVGEEETRQEVVDYVEEFMRYPAANKMIVDTTFLPGNIAVQSILWAVNKKVKR